MPETMPEPGPETGPPSPAAGRRLRICLVIDRVARRSGGAERVLIETANALAARGHEVEVVSHEARRGKPFYPVAFGVIHSNIRRPDATRGRFRRWLDGVREPLHREVRFFGFPVGQLLWLSKHGGFWRRLERHLDAHRPDVAVAFLPPALAALGQVRTRYPLRRIGSLHNVPEQDFANPARWDPSPVDRARRKAALGRMDAVTVLLPEFRAWFPEPLRDRVAVMPNVVRPVPPRRLARAAAERAPLVLSVGRLAAVKRHDLLIDAWARIVAGRPELEGWRLRIFGAGPEEAALKAQVERLGLGERVRLMGHTGEIGAEYLSAAVLAHPAAFEGWGLAVTEALASGLPVVGFADCSGVNTLVRNEENGVLVPADGDRTATFAAALGDLMADGPRRARLGAAGPESVARYGPERIADRWEALLLGRPLPGEEPR